MFAQIAVVVTVVVHYIVMAYIVFGGFLIWRWHWAAWPHLIMIGWAVLSVVHGIDCPLTEAENYFRRLTGAGDMKIGFVDTYLTGVIYPENFEIGAQIIAAVIVVISWAGAALMWRHHRPVRDASAPVERIKLS
jgi:hypothetical protein